MNSQRLVIITPRYWPLVGESELFASHLADELLPLGVRPLVLTGSWSSQWPEAICVREIPVIRVAHAPRGGWSTFLYMLDVARWLRRHRSTLLGVYALGLRHEAYAAIGALQGSRIPVLLRCQDEGVHGDCAWQATTSFGERMRRRCQLADALVAPTSTVAEELVNSGYQADRIHRIPSGAGLGPTRSADRRFRARAALAETNHDLAAAEYAPIMVFVGRLDDAAELTQLLQAWRGIARRWPSARLWLIGDGPARDTLYEQIHLLELQCQVFMPGTFEDMSDVWLAADIYLAPHGTFGHQMMLEAMGAALPVVAADSPLTRGIIKHEQSGLLVPPGDKSAWLAAMSHLCDYPTVAAEMGIAARQTVEQRFPIRQVAQQHLALLNKLRTSSEAQVLSRIAGTEPGEMRGI